MTTLTEPELIAAYGSAAEYINLPAVLAGLVEERIRELLRFRRWYRAQPNWSNWMDLARENDAELRALVRLARRARRIAEASPDPMTLAKAAS